MKNILSFILVITMLLAVPVYAEDSPSSWAVEFIENVKEQNILDETFFTSYQNAITRLEFAYLGVKLYEQYTGKTSEIGNATFTDTSDEWALKAKNLGIVGGYPDGSFKPEKNITRQELAVLFVNTFKASGIAFKEADKDKFVDDNEIADWAISSVYIAKANGIISGVGENYFNAQGNATKEQSLIMFNKGQTSDTITGRVETFVEKLNSQRLMVYQEFTDVVIEVNPDYYYNETYKKNVLSYYFTIDEKYENIVDITDVPVDKIDTYDWDFITFLSPGSKSANNDNVFTANSDLDLDRYFIFFDKDANIIGYQRITLDENYKWVNGPENTQEILLNEGKNVDLFKYVDMPYDNAKSLLYSDYGEDNFDEFEPWFPREGIELINLASIPYKLDVDFQNKYVSSVVLGNSSKTVLIQDRKEVINGVPLSLKYSDIMKRFNALPNVQNVHETYGSRDGSPMLLVTMNDKTEVWYTFGSDDHIIHVAVRSSVLSQEITN